jgi:hypothetical protein
MVLYLCVLIVFSLHRESLKLILATNPSPRWFCHRGAGQGHGYRAHQNEVVDGEAAQWREAMAFGGGEGSSVLTGDAQGGPAALGNDEK